MIGFAAAAAAAAADAARAKFCGFVSVSDLAQGFVLFVSGDTLFQVLEQGWKEAVSEAYTYSSLR